MSEASVSKNGRIARTTYRTWSQAAIYAVLFGCFTAFSGYLSASVLIASDFALYGIGFVLCLGLVDVFLLRGMLARLVVNADAVCVHNLTRNTTIPWSSIQRFELGWSKTLGMPNVGIIHLIDGGEVSIFGIQGPNPILRPNATGTVEMIAELNALLVQQLSARSAIGR